MDNFAHAIAAIKDLMRDGLITDYAVGGAMAMSFWSEPTLTFDLDVFVILPPSDQTLISLTEIYRWARKRGYKENKEHIIIKGLPVQFLPADGQLAEEAIKAAATLDYEGEDVRVIRPEYLVALSLKGSARTAKRLARVGVLMEAEVVDHRLLRRLLERFKLKLPNSK